MEMLNYMRNVRGSPIGVLHDVANDMSTTRLNVRQGDPPITENKEQRRLPCVAQLSRYRGPATTHPLDKESATGGLYNIISHQDLIKI